MSTRDIGRKLENYALEYLKESDPKARLTNNSGAVSGNGDIVHKHFHVECKLRNTRDITLKKDVWEKLLSEIPMYSNKIPLYILENECEDRFVVMSLKDFAKMAKELYDKK